MRVIVWGVALLLSLNAQAAYIVDVLNLPQANRQLIFSKADSSFYSQAKSIAFSSRQPMNLRWKAVTALAEIKGADATGDLILASKNREWFMRNAALMALKEVNVFESRALALKLLKDPALVVRSAAANVLGSQLSAEERSILWREMQADYNYKNGYSLWIRSQILEQLARKPLGSEKALFAKALHESDEKMHESAIRGLEKITGAGLVKGEMSRAKAVSLWRDYLKKDRSL